MATLNQCSFIGRLGKDPEMSYIPQGKAVTKFSIAVDQGKEQKAMWLDIECWDKLAEQMNEFLYKGAQVFVQGRLKKSTYTGKDKVEHLSVAIVATNIQLLDKAKAKEQPQES